MRRLRLPTLIAVVALGLGLVHPSAAALDKKDRKTLSRAPEVLTALAKAPDDRIPEELLERAECVMVFPDVTKAAFFVGGKYGRGVASCRSAPGRPLGAPAFFKIGGGSIGWQWGGNQTDLVLLVMNDQGMRHLLQDKFTLGGEVTAAAGPVGRTAQAGTDITLRTQILSWSRSRGLFVGASIEGASVFADKDANARLYGKGVLPRDILMAGRPVPEAGHSFVSIARQLTSSQPSAARKG